LEVAPEVFDLTLLQRIEKTILYASNRLWREFRFAKETRQR